MALPNSSRVVQVVPYDPGWPEQFARLRDKIWRVVADLAVAIEHVGSTSVIGLAAKPVIDMDVVISSRKEFREIVRRLATLGYEHRGDLGIRDREAFRAPVHEAAHHLYVCTQDSIALRNHLTLRDHLRSHPMDVAEYSALKMRLAAQFAHEIDRYIDRYIEGKSDFILSILARYGFAADDLNSIRKANQTNGPRE